MASIRAGKQPVVIVVDVQVGVMRAAWDAARIIDNVARVVARAREERVPVLWVQHADDELPQGSADWQWVPQLVPAADEPLIGKRYNSSFEDTLLEENLARINATHITLAGAATNWCIRATAYAALDRGYDLTLVKDAHTTKAIETDDGGRIEASVVIDELNIAMTWLSYPGRRTTTSKTDELDFATTER